MFILMWCTNVIILAEAILLRLCYWCCATDYQYADSLINHLVPDILQLFGIVHFWSLEIGIIETGIILSI